jgi:hypothetical protein
VAELGAVIDTFRDLFERPDPSNRPSSQERPAASSAFRLAGTTVGTSMTTAIASNIESRLNIEDSDCAQ